MTAHRLICQYVNRDVNIFLVFYISCSADQGPPCNYPRWSIACKIWNHTNMDCSYRDLECVPPIRHKASLVLLDLSNNRLTYTSGLNGLNNLHSLVLSNNLITYLPDDVFSGLHNLLSLDLNSNNLLSIKNNSFSGLSKLVSLNLFWNRLSFIGSSIFSELKELRSLDLSANTISILEKGAFVELTKITI